MSPSPPASVILASPSVPNISLSYFWVFVFPPFQPGKDKVNWRRSPSPTSGSSYFPLSNPAKTKWIEEDSKSVKQWHEETARPKPWVIHTILVTLSILSVFIKKWVNLIKNSGVISLFRSLINLNQGSFTFKNDEFQFYIHKNDEVYENAHFLLEK